MFVLDDEAWDELQGLVSATSSRLPQRWEALSSRRCSNDRHVIYGGPTLLTGQHRLEGFDCGEPALNDWLARRALGNQAAGTSRTWVVIDRPTGWS